MLHGIEMNESTLIIHKKIISSHLNNLNEISCPKYLFLFYFIFALHVPYMSGAVILSTYFLILILFAKIFT